MGKPSGGFSNPASGLNKVGSAIDDAARTTASPTLWKNPKGVAGAWGDAANAGYVSSGAGRNVNNAIGDQQEQFIVDHQKEGWIAAGLAAGSMGAIMPEAGGSSFLVGNALLPTTLAVAGTDAAGDSLIRKPKAEAAAAAEADAAQQAANDAAAKAAILPPTWAADARRKRTVDGRAGTILTGAGSGSGTGTSLGNSGGRSTSLGL